MMGTGEASGDNRAIEAAEKAIANPLLDGVSMKGAKGVIVSITGGEDMRLMEVDEAANHIRELVDPDANIIWGSAFNNDLEGKIRVSVVATGIENEVGTQAEPAKVFSFPAASKPRVEAPAPVAAPVTQQTAAPASAPEAPAAEEAAEAAPSEDDSDELVLGADTIFTPPVTPNPLPQGSEAAPEAQPGSRRFLNSGAQAEEPAPAPRTSRAAAAPRESSGGTLFERMSSIARGAQKAQVEEEQPTTQRRDTLDLPGFLNRQNNQ
jgi:cell division protein FtsZ